MRTYRCTFVLVGLAAIAGCRSSDRTTTDSASGNVVAQRAATADSGNPLNVTPTAGGAAQVTATDAKSVTKATEYRLTDDNFHKFVAASESLFVLRKRDPQVRALLDQQINDAGAGTRVSDVNAGRKHLESNPAIVNAITSAGMSVRDYFVASIAIAQATRYINNPKAAPPTPALGPNADFLAQRRAELQALHTRTGGATTAAP